MRVARLVLLALIGLGLPAASFAATIHGTARHGIVRGTAKADRIDVIGGGIDSVTCGAGTDVVTADPGDHVGSDCEFVSRRISSDTLESATGEHETEVEPNVFAWGSTVVASFQVGRFKDGGAAGIGWATSTNAGRTWRSGLLPEVTTASGGTAPRASDPAVAYDAAHGTWLVSTLVIGSDFTALGISRSPDGLTWSAPVLAANIPTAALGYDKEWISCDNTPSSPFYGSCYVVYTDLSPATPRIALESSHDGGATWGAPVTVSSAHGADAEGALPLVQPDGALTVVYNGLDTGMFAVRSTDGGATFATPVGIAPISEAVQPLLRAPSLPTATVDSSGRMYVAWADCRFRVRCAGDDVVFSSSTDGVTWSAVARVPGSGFDSFVPGIAADPATPGRLSVVTYVRTASSCSISTCAVGVAVTSSRDGGATWSKPQRLDAVPARYSWLATTSSGQFAGDYVGATFSAGRFVPVFALAQEPTDKTLHEFMASTSLR